jgi:hypothetical protein
MKGLTTVRAEVQDLYHDSKSLILFLYFFIYLELSFPLLLMQLLVPGMRHQQCFIACF